MGLRDRARRLFGRDKPKLSDRTINCQRIDEGIARDMRRKAKKLAEQYDAPPTVAPDEIYEAPYSQWEDLLTDVFAAHHMSDEPTALAPDKIKPSAEMRRRLVNSYISRDEFRESRPDTAMDELNSAFATVRAAQQYRTSLQNELQEHAQRSEEMQAEEDIIEAAQQGLEELQQMVRDGDEPNREAMKQHIADRERARRHLEELADAESKSSMRADVAAVARKAAAAAEEGAKIASSLPGREPGSEALLNADEAFDLAERWTGVEEMWALAKMLGRNVQSMRADRRQRPIGGHDELVGVELGGDITRIITSELGALTHPTLRKKFMLDLVSEDLLQYRFEGHLPEERGPIIVVKDGSISMKGARFRWATSVALALVHIGHDERRDVAVVEFGGPGQAKVWVFPKHQPIHPLTIVECAEHFFNGGTSIYTGLCQAHEIITNATADHGEAFASADIALLTDGEDTWNDDDAELVQDLRSMNTRILGVAISQNTHQYLDQACEHVVDITDLALRGGANDATRFLATGIS